MKTVFLLFFQHIPKFTQNMLISIQTRYTQKCDRLPARKRQYHTARISLKRE